MNKRQISDKLEEIANRFGSDEFFPECPDAQLTGGDVCVDRYPTLKLVELPLQEFCPGCRAYYAIRIAQWQLNNT